MRVCVCVCVCRTGRVRFLLMCLGCVQTGDVCNMAVDVVTRVGLATRRSNSLSVDEFVGCARTCDRGGGRLGRARPAPRARMRA